MEKPFGRDLASARELNATLHTSFPEDRIFRIDHYLGKESVEDLMVFRFSNVLLEPVWKRNYVRSVQVTMAETIGVEGRGSFYDSVGALRDVVQNHLLQVVALLAMEPPVGPEADFLQDEKAKVFAATESICSSNVVRGQYVGYLDEDGVAPGSTTETFVAARLEIDSWRWAGVPFYVRAGKALAHAATEAVVEFNDPPRLLFDEAGGPAPHRNLVRFRLGTDDGVTFTLQAKTPGEHMDSEDVNLTVDFAAALGERQDAYERLLGDALAGNPRRFARQDVVERTWRIVQPMLEDPGPVFPYEQRVVGAAGGRRARAGRLVPAELSGRKLVGRPWGGRQHPANAHDDRGDAHAEGRRHAEPIQPGRRVGDEHAVGQDAEARDSRGHECSPSRGCAHALHGGTPSQQETGEPEGHRDGTERDGRRALGAARGQGGQAGAHDDDERSGHG